MKLLYITRKYPPMIGGMEKMSYALAKEFSKNVDTTIVSWGKSQKFLPLVLPLFLIKALYIIPQKKITHLHIGDGLLSPLGLILKTIFKIKTTISIAGLDITYNFPGYQLLIPKCVAKMDTIICISNSTRDECLKRGIPKEKCIVIPCGVYPEDYIVSATRKDLEKIVGESLKNKKVIITVGRLVKRKGVHWFIENVFPHLDKNTIYLVIGDGPDKERINLLIKEHHLEERVFLLGKIPDKELKIIYNTADIFVMPNIKVDNNIEGFGIVAIEASSTGLPVIASATEGIKDSVEEAKNGWLIEPENKMQWTEGVNRKINTHMNKDKIKEWTINNYSWKVIGKEYLQYFQN